MWTYTTSVSMKDNKRGELQSAGNPAIEVAPPTDFGGPADVWNPEDLLLSSVVSCIMMSSQFFLGQQKIELKSYESTATGTLDKTATGLAFTQIAVVVTASAVDAANNDLLKQIIAKAEKTCPISNTLNCPVSLEINVI